jgi:hypothetical protein
MDGAVDFEMGRWNDVVKMTAKVLGNGQGRGTNSGYRLEVRPSSHSTRAYCEVWVPVSTTTSIGQATLPVE